MPPDDIDEKLFEFYTQGSVEYSALLLASTLGVFSPFQVLSSHSIHSNFATDVLILVYALFSIASGFSLTRLIGNVWLLYTVMPSRMREQHIELASKYDVFNLGRSQRVMSFDRHAKAIECIAFLLLPSIYFVLLGSSLI